MKKWWNSFTRCLTALAVSVFLLTGLFYWCFEGAFVLPYHPIAYNAPPGPYKGTAVYIINMDRSADRREVIFPLAKQLGFPVYRVPGVDGSLLPDVVLDYVLDKGCMERRWPRRELRKGEIGCSLSHMEVWKHFLESPYAHAVIFEDDAFFVPESLFSVIREVMVCQADWDVCSLQTGFEGRALDIARLPSGNTLSFPPYPTWLSGAYIINRKAAKRMLDRALPIGMPLDMYLYRNWEFGLSLVSVEPLPVTQVWFSTIDPVTRRESDPEFSFFLDQSRYVFEIKSRLMHFLCETYWRMKKILGLEGCEKVKPGFAHFFRKKGHIGRNVDRGAYSFK